MRHLGILFSFLIAVCCSVVKSQEANVVGTWWNDDQTSHIRVFKATNGKYYGKIEYLKNEPERLDKNNPDVTKQSEPMLGLVILKGFSYDASKKQWTGGTIYDPDNGKTYDCFMWFETGTDLLYIKGYVLGMKFIGRETRWTRVKE
jgi:uncharacterized protein (DUF2147 family)